MQSDRRNLKFRTKTLTRQFYVLLHHCLKSTPELKVSLKEGFLSIIPGTLAGKQNKDALAKDA